jgi:hypothetical protein
MEASNKTISYIFDLGEGEKHQFDIEIFKDAPTATSTHETKDWTKLDFHRCDNCSYQASNQCPIALALVKPSETIGQLASHHRAHISVITPERTYSKHTDVQEGLGSMLGLIMATSGCPNTAFLKPAAWFHLPFSTFEETLYRICSMWLLRQYFDNIPSKNLQAIMESITPAYENIGIINKGIFQRLKAASVTTKDAPFNAVAILNSFSMMIPFSIEESLEEIRSIFQQSTHE